MGILSRFRDIMASNVNALLDRNEDPEKTVDTYMRSLNSDLGQVKAETASVLAEERRTKRELDDCKAEIGKLQRYAEKSVEAGNDADAVKFLEKKAPLAEKASRLEAAYDAAAANVAKMKQMHDKLEADIGRLEERRTKLKEKMAAVKAQQRLNAGGSSTGGGVDAIFDAMEEKADSAYNEAMALAELRAEPKDDLDELLEQLDKPADTKSGGSAEKELAALKEKLKKKE